MSCTILLTVWGHKYKAFFGPEIVPGNLLNYHSASSFIYIRWGVVNEELIKNREQYNHCSGLFLV